MPKDPTINLIDFRSICKNNQSYNPSDEFKIDSLKNTIDYRAGQFITEITVKDLINMGWNVNIRQTRNSDFN